MTSIDLDQLANVTGGQGGGFLGGLDQFLSFFQTEGFQQILGGLRQIIGSFGGAPQEQAPQQDPQAADQAA